MRDCWDKVIDTLTVLTVFAGVAAAIAAAVFANNVGVKQTYLVGSTEVDPLVRGLVVTDSGSDEISYDLAYKDSIAPIYSIAIVGPLNINTNDGPIHVALCGAPSLVACDISVPNTLQGSIRMTSPAGGSLRVKISDLRTNRMDYEFRVFSPLNATLFRSKLPSGGAQ